MSQIPTFEEIRSAILRDLVSLQPTADTNSDSDNYIRASVLASCAVGQYAHQAWVLRQFFPDTADTAYLERHCNLRGIRRKNPTYASGTVIASGIAGSVIAAGAQIKCGDLFYTTQSVAVIDAAGAVTVDIIAASAGAAYNQAGQSAQFMAAPSGVSTDLTLIEAVGGTDKETDTALLARLLELLRRPAAGGNKYDYKNWALSVDGVSSAYVYPLRRGLGTVDIVITSAGNVPSDEIVAAAQDYIDSVRPVTAKNSLVIKPDVVHVDVSASVKLSNTTLDSASADIKSALKEYFAAIQPGDAVIVSQLEAVISEVSGVTDRKLTAPLNNIEADTTDSVQWFMLGNVMIETM